MTTAHTELIWQEPVLLTLYAWTVEVTVEENRALPRLEEAVLRLAGAGVREFARFGELLGLDDERLLSRAFGQLRLRGALAVTTGEEYALTEAGRRLLERAQERTLRQVELKLWHDPYRDELTWPWVDDEEVLNRRQQEASPLRVLEAPVELRHDVLQGRYREVQELISRDGLPQESEADAQKQRHAQRAVVNLAPRYHERLYVPATLQVWRDRAGHGLTYLLERDGRIDEKASRTLRDLEDGGAEPVPLVPLATTAASGAAQRLEQELSGMHPRGQVIPVLEAARAPMFVNVLARARQRVLLVSSFVRDGQADTALLAALRRELLAKAELRAVIVLVPEAGKGSARVTREAARVLQELSALAPLAGRFAWREVPGVGAQAVLADDLIAVVSTRELAQHPDKRGFAVPYLRHSLVSDGREVAARTARLLEVLAAESPPARPGPAAPGQSKT